MKACISAVAVFTALFFSFAFTSLAQTESQSNANRNNHRSERRRDQRCGHYRRIANEPCKFPAYEERQRRAFFIHACRRALSRHVIAPVHSSASSRIFAGGGRNAGMEHAPDARKTFRECRGDGGGRTDSRDCVTTAPVDIITQQDIDRAA